VLATGLGQTWRAAFASDRPEYRRALLVPHRDEILSQLLATFRRVRPRAARGRYPGAEKAPEADVRFASIQTLSRLPPLTSFDGQTRESGRRLSLVHRKPDPQHSGPSTGLSSNLLPNLAVKTH
jgi:superfamily II DNA or RNA helicase